MKLVIDACIFVAAQVREQAEHEAAQALLKACVEGEFRLYVPSLVLAEVAGAVARLTQQPALGEVGALRVSHVPRLAFRHIDLPFASSAARVAARHGLQGADSHYVALARELRCTLITNDAVILQRCPPTMTVLRPAAWLKQQGLA